MTFLVLSNDVHLALLTRYDCVAALAQMTFNLVSREDSVALVRTFYEEALTLGRHMIDKL